jgi:hypothetical protein
MWNKKLMVGAAAIALVGCASIPSGPRVTVMPAPGNLLNYSFRKIISADNLPRNLSAKMHKILATKHSPPPQ